MENKPAWPTGWAVLCGAAIYLAGNVAQAAGFALIEQSASGMGQAFAGSAAVAEDASTLFFNPAGITELDRPQTLLAGHLVRPKAKFSNASGSEEGGVTKLVPNYYYTRKLREGPYFGFSVNVPFGLSTEYPADWQGRYHAVSSDLKTLSIGPSVAFAPSRHFSLGVGVNFQYAEALLSNRIDLGRLCLGGEASGDIPGGACAAAGLSPGASDGGIEVEGDHLGLGFNLGVLFKLTDDHRIGVGYRSAVVNTLDGEADFTLPSNATFLTKGGTQLVDTGAKARARLPDSVTLSWYKGLGERLAIMADAAWTNWSTFQELRIKFDNDQEDSVQPEEWEDSWRFALGVRYRASERWLLRAGTALDQTPIPNKELRTPRIPGNDRHWLSLGFGYRLSSLLHVDVGYAHLFVADTKIANREETTQQLLEGEYDSSVDIVSAQIIWRI